MPVTDPLRTADLGRYRLGYLDVGSGPAVVLIHGLAGDHSAWRVQVALLRDRYRVIAFDNRGAGASTQIDEAVSTRDLADDTLALMTQLGIERAHIVGRSMGGAVAQHMALAAPDRIASLVLCASFACLDPLGRRVLSNMREALEWRGRWDDHARHSVQNFVSAKFFNERPGEVAALSQLGRIAQPALVMGGSVDPICSPTATNALAAGLPNAKLEMFEGSSHFFLLEQPKHFNALLVEWLTTHADRTAA
jgi:3-oxoadipate enol-lactonase